MTSVSAGHIILTPTQPVGSGRSQCESNPFEDARDIHKWQKQDNFIDFFYPAFDRKRRRGGGETERESVREG